MLIVSNNCIGGFCYQKTHTQYNNPFIFSMTRFKDLIPLLTDTINFANFKLEPTIYERVIGRAFDIIADGKVRISYAHYLYDETYAVPTRCGIDIKYARNYEYTLQRYLIRAARMVKTNEPITFALSWYPASGTVDELCQVASLCKKTNTRFVIVTPKIDACAKIFDMFPEETIISHAVIDNDWVGNTVNETYKKIVSYLSGVDL